MCFPWSFEPRAERTRISRSKSDTSVSTVTDGLPNHYAPRTRASRSKSKSARLPEGYSLKPLPQPPHATTCEPQSSSSSACSLTCQEHGPRAEQSAKSITRLSSMAQLPVHKILYDTHLQTSLPQWSTTSFQQMFQAPWVFHDFPNEVAVLSVTDQDLSSQQLYLNKANFAWCLNRPNTRTPEIPAKSPLRKLQPVQAAQGDHVTPLTNVFEPGDAPRMTPPLLQLRHPNRAMPSTTARATPDQRAQSVQLSNVHHPSMTRQPSTRSNTSIPRPVRRAGSREPSSRTRRASTVSKTSLIEHGESVLASQAAKKNLGQANLTARQTALNNDLSRSSSISHGHPSVLYPVTMSIPSGNADPRVPLRSSSRPSQANPLAHRSVRNRSKVVVAGYA